ncbi:MAG: hypothetical protein KDD60_06270, partial [Bdellovibrionales bacterium]|nr:hypothetical protein [Bdellovibrionales bacterium]
QAPYSEVFQPYEKGSCEPDFGSQAREELVKAVHEYLSDGIDAPTTTKTEEEIGAESRKYARRLVGVVLERIAGVTFLNQAHFGLALERSILHACLHFSNEVSADQIRRDVLASMDGQYRDWYAYYLKENGFAVAVSV